MATCKIGNRIYSMVLTIVTLSKEEAEILNSFALEGTTPLSEGDKYFAWVNAPQK